MPTPPGLRKLAHQGEPLSGEAISRQMGVTRAAVWKGMDRLRQAGGGKAGGVRDGPADRQTGAGGEKAQSLPAAAGGQQVGKIDAHPRAAVWKGMDRLRQAGWEIGSATNRGYRLVEVPDLMTAPVVEHFLPPGRKGPPQPGASR